MADSMWKNIVYVNFCECFLFVLGGGGGGIGQSIKNRAHAVLSII